MKRDMDLVRKILLWLEDHKKGYPYIINDRELSIDEYSREEIIYHVYLMHQAELVNANVKEITAPFLAELNLKGMTWKGHEFLEASRDPMRWEQAKEIISKKVSGITFNVLFKVLESIVTQAVLPS